MYSVELMGMIENRTVDVRECLAVREKAMLGGKLRQCLRAWHSSPQARFRDQRSARSENDLAADSSVPVC